MVRLLGRGLRSRILQCWRVEIFAKLAEETSLRRRCEEASDTLVGCNSFGTRCGEAEDEHGLVVVH